MNIVFNVPFMTIAQFAQHTGLSKSYISKKAQDGTFPTLPKKSPRESVLINLVQLTENIKRFEESQAAAA